MTGPFLAGVELTADVLNDAWLLSPRGIMAAPVTTSSIGTATAADTVEVRDSVLGNYVFVAETGRRYRVHLDGLQGNAGAVSSRMITRIRDSGSVATPTTASTLLAESITYLTETSTAGRATLSLSRTFTAATGTHTLSVFTQSPDSVIMTPTAPREIYVEDIGPV